MPDLAGFNTLLQMVIRDRLAQPGNRPGEVNSVTTFNNNLIRPSSYVGLHAQMLEYDITQHNGVVAGGNIAGGAVVGPIEIDPATGTPRLAASPFNTVTYRWYAGDLASQSNASGINLVATPVEFGGGNLSPADPVKQGQKAMIGALVVEPQYATWANSGGALPNDLTSLEQVGDRQNPFTIVQTPFGPVAKPNKRGTRADMVVTAADGTTPLFDDLVLMKQSGLNHRYKDGEAVPNIASEGQGIPEDSHDAGQKALNYGSEPAWFRFGLPADVDFGPAGLGGVDAEKMFSNALAGNWDPWTPVFTAVKGQQARMRVLQPTGVGRGSTYDLHGHIWARDPYLPENGAGCLTAGTLGGCGLSSVAIGHNPLAWYLGGQESWTPGAHFDMVLPKAGGLAEVVGDYLVRDHASFGVTDGLWGIMRVAAAPAPNPCDGNVPPTAEITGDATGRLRFRDTLNWSAVVDDEKPATLTYAWTFTDPVGRERSNGSGDTFSVRLNRRWPTGTYVVNLTVTDECGESVTATFEVDVTFE